MSAKFKVGDKIRHKQDGYRGVITRVITMNYPCGTYAYEYTIPDRTEPLGALEDQLEAPTQITGVTVHTTKGSISWTDRDNISGVVISFEGGSGDARVNAQGKLVDA